MQFCKKTSMHFSDLKKNNKNKPVFSIAFMEIFGIVTNVAKVRKVKLIFFLNLEEL